MFGWLILIFITVPLVELSLLIWVGQRIDVLPTLALIVGTGILGAALARHQGMRVLSRFQGALGEGRVPHQEVLDGILIIIAGAVLITPGLLTDTAGFLLLVPAVRARIRRFFSESLKRRMVVIDPRSAPAEDSTTIEGKFTVNEDRPTGEENSS